MSEGHAIVRANWVGTGALALTALIAAVTRATPAEVIAVALSLVLFVAGCAAFVAAYARSVARSRHEQIDVAGVFLMVGGSAPRRVRTRLLGALLVQTAVAIAAAAADYVLAFAILAPTYGLGLAGLWTARHGTFPPKRQPAATAR